MEYGLIKDTTMQGIADGLRAAGLVQKTWIDYSDCIRYKSDNATSLDDPTPTHKADSTITITIPEGVAMKVVFKYGFSQETLVQVGELSYEGGTTRGVANIIGSHKGGAHTFNATTATFKLTHAESPVGDAYCAVTFIVYPLDTDGNPLPKYVEKERVFTISPEEMIEAINNCPPLPPEEAFELTGNIQYKFYYGRWDWFAELYSDRITTKDITNAASAFNNSTLTEIPFDINIKDCTSLADTFSSMSYLKVCPKVRGSFKNTSSVDVDCIAYAKKLKSFEDLFTPEMIDELSELKITSKYTCIAPTTFNNCSSMREVPSWWKHFKLDPESTVFPAYDPYKNCFQRCTTLNKILDIPVWHCTGAATSNLFSNTFNNLNHVSDITFETNNGQPIEASWKTQTISLTMSVGVSEKGYGGVDVVSYGLPEEKEIKDEETYQVLKDDVDAWSTDFGYSRYDHDSAVRTINSLPDTSAYLATAGGTNTIKFKGASGSATDGGAINTLTAEEIAVAAAKGWTVTLV